MTGLALLTAGDAVARPEQVVDAFVVLLGQRAILVPNVCGVEPANIRSQQIARFAKLLVALRSDVKLLPEAGTYRVVPVVRIAHVDAASRREPDVTLFGGTVSPKLVSGCVALHAAAQRALFPVRVETRAAQFPG